MVDPPDRMVSVFRDGDDRELPSPTGGEFGTVPVTDYHQKRGNWPPIWRTWEANIAVGATQVFQLDDFADLWLITSNATANQRWKAYRGIAAGGYADAWGGAMAEAGIPGGDQTALTIVNTGAAIVSVLVRAVRGYQGAKNTFGS